MPVELLRDSIETVTSREVPRTVAVIVRAFAADPVARWAYPDADSYEEGFSAFVRAFGGRAFAHGTADCVEGFAGVALWLPPGVEPDEDALIAVIRETIKARHQDALFALMEEMGAYHPTVPHWYLPLIGVDPAHQGRGYGSRLLERGLARCDRDRLPAYLEASSEQNARLYERHGFERVGTIQAAGSPPLTAMLRPPR